SPTTSGASTTSSSPPPSIQEKSILPSTTNNVEQQQQQQQQLPPPPPPLPLLQQPTSIPMDLSNSRTTIKIEENSSSYNSILQAPSSSKSLSTSITPSFLSSFTTKSCKSKTKETLSTPPSLLSPHPFHNGLLFSPPGNPSGYFPSPPPSFLHGSSNPFGLSPFHPHHPHHSPTSSLHSNHNNNKNKLSPSSSSPSALSPSSYLTIPPQLYFNPLTAPRFPSACSSSPSSKSSR
ncbi:unnamed protein product, partial [Rotaria magnacalcarata]